MVVDIKDSTLTLNFGEPGRGVLRANLNKYSSRLRVKRPLSRTGLTEQGNTSGNTGALSGSSKKTGDFISAMEIATLSAGRISYLLRRMHELSISASNGLLCELRRGELNKDFSSLHNEIERIVGTTKFEGKNLLNGSLNAITIKTSSVGIGTGPETAQVEMKLLDFSIPKTIASGIGTKASAMRKIKTIDTVLSDTDAKNKIFYAAATKATATLKKLKRRQVD